MTSAIIIAALASALLQSGWNVLAKLHSEPRELLVGIVVATASLSLIALPFIGMPPLELWLWIAGASACNVLYIRALADAYSRANFGLVYAVARAVVPPLIFLFGWIFLNEAARVGASIGVVLVVLGVSMIAPLRFGCRGQLRGLLLAGVAGLLLATSLLFDVSAIRSCHEGFICLIRYSLTIAVVTAIGLLALSAFERLRPFAGIRSRPDLCYAGAVLLFASYVCGVWAYVQGPVVLVSAVHEGAIIFGGVLAVFVLRERVSLRQWAAMGLATVGSVLVQIG